MESINQKLLIEILTDQNLKKEFMTNPKKVMKDKGMEVDDECEYKVVEDTKMVKHLVIPWFDDITPDKPEEIEKRFSKVVL